MYLFETRRRTGTMVCLAVLAVAALSAAQEPVASAVGAVRGTVVDSSAGVLPGVSVVATSVDGRPLETTVTNATGEFSFDRLPAGPVALVFHLDGFVDAKTSLTIQPRNSSTPGNGASLVQRLALAAMSEVVVVRGDPPAPPPPPPPVLVPVPPHDEAAVCAPARAEWPVQSFGKISSGRSEATQGLFGKGDEVLIDGGTLNGLGVGQNLVVRRHYRPALASGRGPDALIVGEHSSGLLQIVAVAEREARAVVVYSCDAMLKGDYLAAFQPEPIREPDPAGTPAFDMATRVLFADDGQSFGVKGRMMVIDRGSARGVRPGQRVTLFRRLGRSALSVSIVGEAVVVAVRTESATVRVEQTSDVINFGNGGDWAAPQQLSQHSSH